MFDVFYQEETLLNVMRSVTRNWRSILLTAVLAIILVYLFSIIGYLTFQDDFVMPVSAKDSNGKYWEYRGRILQSPGRDIVQIIFISLKALFNIVAF